MSFRAPAAVQRRIDELADARGCSRSLAIRAAILEATMPADAAPVPSAQEVLELLGEAARAGSVAAMKELRQYHEERRTRDDDPFAEFDELARRRTGR